MNQTNSRENLSRIDKLFMDRNATSDEESYRRREMRGLDIVAGDDVKGSYGLQLALLTAVNLGVKCFAGQVTVHATAEVLLSSCVVPFVQAATLSDAVVALGGKPTRAVGLTRKSHYLVLGDAAVSDNAVRITYDGWQVAVGPAGDLPRMNERPYCPLASIAAAAIGVSELFSEFASINIAACRQVVNLSLWRPDLSTGHPDSLGQPIHELPISVGVFGLGHLGQAYLWGLAALPFSSARDSTVLLCDDDKVEAANLETGALLNRDAVTHLKTRVAAQWLEARGFSTRLLECRVDHQFRRTDREPLIALSGFDDNKARQWLANAGFRTIFDCGLGGEASNFDTIAFRAWPNPRPPADLWPLETEVERATREVRNHQRATGNSAYQTMDADECGRILMADASVAVPFVGAVASCVVLAELLKCANGGPTLSELKLRLCSLGTVHPIGHMVSGRTNAMRGVEMQLARSDAGKV